MLADARTRGCRMAEWISARKRACAILCAFVWAGLSTIQTQAAPFFTASSGSLTALADDRTAEPFGLNVAAFSEGPVAAKWRSVQTVIDSELQIVSNCRDDRSQCGSPEALQFIDIVDAAKSKIGLARIGDINRAINLAIRPVSDMAQYGVEDYWASPLAVLKAGAGDCEDYAIAKFVALHQAGVASADLRLVILRDPVTAEDHAVVAARNDGEWRILDNRHLAMVSDSDIDRRAPLFAINSDGVKRYSDAPALLVEATRRPVSGATTSDDTSVPSAIVPQAVDVAEDVMMTRAP